MENTTKVILILFILLISCHKKNKYSLIKENLYQTNKGQIVMKLLNKGIRHPSKEIKWKDTIYRSYFRFEHIDSVVSLNNIVDIKTYKIKTLDTYFEDKNYIYINAYYKSGENQYKIIKKDSNTVFLNNDSLRILRKIYYKGNIVRDLN